MGRYSGFGYKSEVDGLIWLDMAMLKKLGFLSGAVSQPVSWTNTLSQAKNRIMLDVNLYTKIARLTYTTTDLYTEEKVDYNYPIALESTPCNLGGERWWFICPLVVNGVYCGRRIRKLYKDGRYFGCRACQNLCYSSQNVNPKFRYFHLAIDSSNKAEELYAKIRTPYYKGAPTRKMKRYLELTRRSDYYAANLPSFEDLLRKV